ncbi:MAG: indolepyruvate ferredoxin oxidoreductase family protein [Acidimicrobiia bacterium]|nr:indolepyruvate ferredoxin oxidoreductase family protein [Acidimicrobiia bacterium]
MTDLAARPDLSGYELADRFRLEDGRVFLSGVQALARLPVDQLRIDRRNGLSTAAYVSGYQGSPVATFQEEASRAAATVPDLPIVIRPGLNEELAATSVMGSQLAETLSDKRYDGVMAVWYGKAPGLDRAGDAIRHGVFAGTGRYGGVMAIVGDDPAAKSSTLPSSSDATLVDLHMPILFPGDVQEALDLSRHAIALSRSSGIWVGLKLVTPVADGIGTVEVHPGRVVPEIPTMEFDGTTFVPHPSGRLLTPYTLEMEREFQQVRSVLARRYGVVNELNRVTVHGPDDWIGIAASGHTYHELREALGLLGLSDDDALRAAGIRLFQLLMPVPVDEQQVRDFAHGLAEVLVVEEKNPTLELLVKSAMYDSAERPKVVGRFDEHGASLVPGTGMLDADRLLVPLRARLAQRLGDDRLAPLPRVREKSLIPLEVNRTPFYCSGCPHNLSTRVPEGTLVGGGIGCHAMVALMEPERVGDIAGLTAMGNEGAQWIGMAPFVERGHFIQNLGDGTYFHSGSLSVRAAVAAGVDITFKLLYNGTVAMTGGQDPQGQQTVPDVVQSLLLEGVSKVIVTSDEPEKWDGADFGGSADGRVEVRDRTRLMETQVELAEVPGVTVLLHDQECAAEKRRARSRGLVAKPGFRIVINERVCEGCGDCGDKSNCLSVQPVDTPYGRKTRIHQTSCNFDMSCLQGDCPSFATVTVDPAASKAAAASLRGATMDDAAVDLPDPIALVPADGFTVRLSGIGGTGVITVSQVLGTAAMLDGMVVRGLDQTGLSQKAGPVVSDLRLSRGEVPASNHANSSGVDCLLAFDLLVAAGDSHRVGADPERTIVVGSVAATPTGEMVAHPSTPYPSLDALTGRLGEVSRADHNRYLDSGAVATGLFGDATTANILLLGVAVQHGAVPVRPERVERAIELNGVAVARNIAAFRWGRRWAAHPAEVEQAAGFAAAVAPETTDQLIERLAIDLVGYQSERYAGRFRRLVEVARRAEHDVDPSSVAFTVAVARYGHKLMAYKDEYEVARLLLAPEARAAYEAVGGPGTKVTWRLHPPMLRSMGLKEKLKLGPRIRPVLALLARTKGLRGTLADPFRWAKVRRMERAMIPEYEKAVKRLAAGLRVDDLDDAVAIASLPDQVRGYEDIKLPRAERYRAELAERLAAFARS